MKCDRNWSEENRVSERSSPDTDFCVCVCVRAVGRELAQLRSRGTRKAIISFGDGGGGHWIWEKSSKWTYRWHWTLSDFLHLGILGPGSQALKGFKTQRVKNKKH